MILFNSLNFGSFLNLIKTVNSLFVSPLSLRALNTTEDLLELILVTRGRVIVTFLKKVRNLPTHYDSGKPPIIIFNRLVQSSMPEAKTSII